MKINVLGIDPAFANMGLVKATVDIDTLEVTVTDMTLVKTEKSSGKTVRKNSDDLRRATELHAALHSHAKGSNLIIAEIPGGSQSAAAARGLGIAVGVIASSPIPVIQVQPIEVKQAVTGSKTATKEQMINWAASKHPDASWKRRKFKGVTTLTKDNEHLADACATIEAGVRSDQFKQVISLIRGALNE